MLYLEFEWRCGRGKLLRIAGFGTLMMVESQNGSVQWKVKYVLMFVMSKTCWQVGLELFE